MVYYLTAQACVVVFLLCHSKVVGKLPMQKSKHFITGSLLRVLCLVNIHQFKPTTFVKPAVVGDTPVDGICKQTCTRCGAARYKLIE